MNTIDLWVIEVIASPYEKYGKWFIDVMAESYGTTSYSSLMFETWFEADAVTIGYKFKA